MRAYNTARKTRHQMTLSDFRGVDYSTSPMRVALNRATEMSNFIYENGVNQKRHGWEQIFDDEGAINGGAYSELRTMGGTSDKTPLVIIGDSLYALEDGVKEFKGEVGQTIDGYQFLPFGFELFILGGKMKRYTPYGRMLDITEDAYVPTTTIGIRANGEAVGTSRTAFEKVNLLTPTRKNTLIGVDKESGTWQLDIAPSIADGSIHISVTTAAGESKYTNVGANIVAEGTTTPNVGSLVGGELTLTFNTKPILDNEANIIVEYNSKKNNADVIRYARFGVTFGVDGNTNRLFVAGGVPNLNRIYYSEVDNPKYFPDTNTISLGNNGSPITGFLRLQDNLLAVFKSDPRQGEANVYYISGKNLDTFDNQGNLINRVTVFPAIGSVLGETPVNFRCCINYNNEHLILSRNGLYSIQLTQNLATSERNTYSRSYSIDKRLKELDLTQTHMMVFEDKLYIGIGEEMFVCDQKCRYRHADDGSLQYEWWHWHNIKANCLFLYEEEVEIEKYKMRLAFGTKDGEVNIFKDGYADIDIIKSQAGDLALTDSDKISYNQLISGVIKNGNEIRFNNDELVVLLSDNVMLNADTPTSYIKTDGLRLMPEEDAEVMITNPMTSGLNTDVTYYVREMNGATFTLDTGNYRPITLRSGGFSIWLKLKNRRLLINDVVNTASEKTFKVYDLTDKMTPLRVSKYMSKETIITSRIYHKIPVVAKWFTPVLDMGNNAVSKTLTKMTISTEKNINSKVRFGYETREIIGMLNAKGVSAFSFDDIDFTDFTFETGFASSYSQVVNVRNYNYIIFRYLSENDKNCAINDLTIEYKYNKNNRGVN